MANGPDFGEVFRKADPAAWQAAQGSNFVEDQESVLRGLRTQYVKLFEAVDRANRNAIGTPVQEVLSESDAGLAVSFIDFVAKRGFLGADELAWDPIFPADGSRPEIEVAHGLKPRWTVRGYKIGFADVPEGSADVFAQRTALRASEQPEVFLCEDHRLRTGYTPNRYHTSWPRQTATLYGNLPLFVDRDGSIKYKRIVYPRIPTWIKKQVWQEGYPSSYQDGMWYPGTAEGWVEQDIKEELPGDLSHTLIKIAKEWLS